MTHDIYELHSITLNYYNLVIYCVYDCICISSWKGFGRLAARGPRKACSRSLGLDGAIAWWWTFMVQCVYHMDKDNIMCILCAYNIIQYWIILNNIDMYLVFLTLNTSENESSQGSLFSSRKSQIHNPFRMGSVGACWGLWLHSARQAMLATKHCTEHDELVVHSPTSRCRRHWRHRNWDSPPAVHPNPLIWIMIVSNKLGKHLCNDTYGMS